MGKRKALRALDGNSMSRFQRLLESDNEFSTSTWKKELAASSKTPKISNCLGPSSTLTREKPPKPRNLSEALSKVNVTTRRREDAKQNVGKRKAIFANLSIPSLAKRPFKESLATSKNIDMVVNHHDHLSDEDMDCAESSASLDSDPSSSDESLPISKTRDNFTPLLPAKHSSNVVSSVRKYAFDLEPQKSITLARKIKVTPLVTTSGARLPKDNTQIFKNFLGQSVGGDLLTQSDSIDGSEVTIPTLTDKNGHKLGRSRRSEVGQSDSVPHSIVCKPPVKQEHQEASTRRKVPVVTEQIMIESDSSAEVWSIDDDSSNVPIKFSLDTKKYLHPPLPPGWKIKVSKSHKRPFYVHPDFGMTWHCPVILPQNAERSFRRLPKRQYGRKAEEQETIVPSPPKVGIQDDVMRQDNLQRLQQSSAALASDERAEATSTRKQLDKSHPTSLSDLVNRYNRDYQASSFEGRQVHTQVERSKKQEVSERSTRPPLFPKQVVLDVPSRDEPQVAQAHSSISMPTLKVEFCKSDPKDEAFETPEEFMKDENHPHTKVKLVKSFAQRRRKSKLVLSAQVESQRSDGSSCASPLRHNSPLVRHKKQGNTYEEVATANDDNAVASPLRDELGSTNKTNEQQAKLEISEVSNTSPTTVQDGAPTDSPQRPILQDEIPDSVNSKKSDSSGDGFGLHHDASSNGTPYSDDPSAADIIEEIQEKEQLERSDHDFERNDDFFDGNNDSVIQEHHFDGEKSREDKLSKSISSSMSSRVSNPPHPLCSLQTLDKICGQRKTKKARKRRSLPVRWKSKMTKKRRKSNSRQRRQKA